MVGDADRPAHHFAATCEGASCSMTPPRPLTVLTTLTDPRRTGLDLARVPAPAP